MEREEKDRGRERKKSRREKADGKFSLEKNDKNKGKRRKRQVKK